VNGEGREIPSDNPTTPAAGALMGAEVSEQTEAWQRLLESGCAQLIAAAHRIRHYDPRFVLFVARGTSDHAALYGKYLIEIRHRLPAGLVSPSTMTAYAARPTPRGTLMVGVSQSGGSPDLVQSLRVAQEQGALTVAVTNKADSPLTEAAEISLDVMAGPERAVAATKSYSPAAHALSAERRPFRRQRLGGSGNRARTCCASGPPTPYAAPPAELSCPRASTSPSPPSSRSCRSSSWPCTWRWGVAGTPTRRADCGR